MSARVEHGFGVRTGQSCGVRLKPRSVTTVEKAPEALDGVLGLGTCGVLRVDARQPAPHRLRVSRWRCDVVLVAAPGSAGASADRHGWMAPRPAVLSTWRLVTEHEFKTGGPV